MTDKMISLRQVCERDALTMTKRLSLEQRRIAVRLERLCDEFGFELVLGVFSNLQTVLDDMHRIDGKHEKSDARRT